MSSTESDNEGESIQLTESGDIPADDFLIDEDFEEDKKKRVVRGMLDKTHTKTLDYNYIVETQRSSIERANEILNIKPALIRILLRHCGWDVEKLILRLLEEGDTKIFKEANILREPIVTIQGTKQKCTICEENFPLDKMSSASCGHLFCNSCWNEYLTIQINEAQVGGGLIHCMKYQCNILVDEDLVKKIVNPELFKKYMNFLLDSYVTKNPYHVWCPTPGCGSAISISRGDTMVGVQCGKCHRSFCFACQRDPHLPATCAMVTAWQQKAKDESETANWLISHTKECPQCHRAVEKNGGCNHISCTCGAHFCWMCLGLFDPRTVYNHACNAFDDRNAFANANAQTAKATLERYMHYHNRFFTHEQSKKFEANILTTIREKMNKLFERDKANTSWISVQYLEQSTQILFECRENLKWTYVFAYYMFDQIQNPVYLQGMKPFKNEEEMRRAKAQFEFHQEGLESTTEKLSGMLEMSVEQIAKEKDYRVKVLDLTKVLQTKFDAMFEVVEWIKTKGSTGNLEDLKRRLKQYNEETKERQKKADEEFKQWQLRQRTLKK